MPRKKEPKEIRAEMRELKKQLVTYGKEYKALLRQAAVIDKTIGKKEERLVKLQEWLDAA